MSPVRPPSALGQSHIDDKATQRQRGEQRRIEQHRSRRRRRDAALPSPSGRVAGDTYRHQRGDGAEPESQHAESAEQWAAAGRGGRQRGVKETAGQEAEYDTERVATARVPCQPGDGACPAGRRAIQSRQNAGDVRQEQCGSEQQQCRRCKAEPWQPARRSPAEGAKTRIGRQPSQVIGQQRAAPDALPLAQPLPPAGVPCRRPPVRARNRRTSARSASCCRPRRRRTGRATAHPPMGRRRTARSAWRRSDAKWARSSPPPPNPLPQGEGESSLPTLPYRHDDHAPASPAHRDLTLI